MSPSLPPDRQTSSDSLCHNVPSAAAQMCLNVPSPSAAGALDAAHSGTKVPERARMCHEHAPVQNEPTEARRADASSPPKPLSFRQRSAARLMALGHRSVDIARHLDLNRHTIARWKRDPRFVAEVGQMLAHLDAAMVATSRRGASAPGPALNARRENFPTRHDRDGLL
jgi:hypothetical protein